MLTQRRVVYIRAASRPPLYFRFTGGQFHLVRRILYPDKREYHGFHIAVGDFVEIETAKRILCLEIGEDSDFTEEPKFIALSGHIA